MLNVPYDFYEETYLAEHAAVIPDADWTYFARDAALYLDNASSGRVSVSLEAGILELAKLCICELAELEYKIAKGERIGSSGPLASYSNDGQSGTFQADADGIHTKAGADKARRGITAKYLGRTGLLYRGGGCYAQS